MAGGGDGVAAIWRCGAPASPGKVHTMQHISTHTPDIHFTLDTGFPTLTGDLGSETNWSRPHVGLTYTHYLNQ